jgi:hypothetical protein
MNFNGNSSMTINGSSSYGIGDRQGTPWIFWVTTPMAGLHR